MYVYVCAFVKLFPANETAREEFIKFLSFATYYQTCSLERVTSVPKM